MKSPREKPITPRKKPVQARSRLTVELVLRGAARVFRREGFAATTNRIAEVAGVSVGSLYEYFPNKESLLVALAEAHVDRAERGVDLALREPSLPAMLEALQSAIVASHEYPSQALQLVADPALGAALRARVSELRSRADAELMRRASGARPDPELRARTAWGLIAELSSRAVFELDEPGRAAPYLRHLRELAVRQLE